MIQTESLPREGLRKPFLPHERRERSVISDLPGTKIRPCHLRMLQMASDHGFHFDAVQMPLNVMDAHFRSFQHQVVPVVLKEQAGVLGMKTFGDHFILSSKRVTPIEALHYSMSLPISVVITGIDKPEILEQAMEAVRTYKKLDDAAIGALLPPPQTAAENGRFELYKISTHFDGTVHNPASLG